jgi:EmrB/QacA subfamily drug resistance transporter
MNSRQRWTLILTAVASLMAGLDTLVVATATNMIRLDLHASIGELDWIVNAYTLTIAVFLLTAAAASDRLGRRRVLVAGIVVFTAASAACALAPSIGVLIAARAVQGVGTAIVLPAALALVSEAFPAERRGKALGLFSGIVGLAILGGPVIGGAVVQGLAWQWIFWLNVPIGIVLVPFILRKVTEGFGPRAPFDVGGLTWSGLGALGLVWGLVRGDAAGWSSPSVYFPLAGGAAALVLFVLWERRTPAPMVPMSLFRNPAFGAANAAGFLMTASIFGAAFFFAQYLQAGLGEDPLTAGLRMLPWTATLFLVAPVAGGLVNRLGERSLVMAGLAAQAAGFAWMAAAVGHGYPAMVPAMVLAGVGGCTAMPAVQTAAVGAVPPSAIGQASGVYNAMRQLGGAFGIAILSAVFTAHGGFASVAAIGHGFRATMVVTTAVSAAGALAGAGLTRRRPAAPAPLAPEELPAPAQSLRARHDSGRERLPRALRPDEGQAVQEQAGSLISKQQPTPVFSTRTLPWWASTTPRTIARPSPAPLPGAGLRASVPRQARSKTRGRSASGMPPQPSATASRASPSSGLASTCTQPPGGVCRMALASRLVSARDSSRGSARTASCPVALPSSRTPCSRASASVLASTSLTRSFSVIWSGESCRAPEWRRDSSNRSSTIVARRSASARICLW